MGMHKIIFGTIVFFSLAFLAACGGGGSGSAGSAGAKGDTGTTGATGSIAVPSAETNTFVTAVKDTAITLGSITVRINGLGAGRITDVIAGCTRVAQGSPNVWAGG